MSKQNFKSQAKRKRELAKLDKRQAKDQKRALKRADGQPDGVAVAPAVTPALSSLSSRVPAAVPAVPAPLPPMTLAQAVERWKTTKVVKAKRRF
jgi:hypothetical protein